MFLSCFCNWTLCSLLVALAKFKKRRKKKEEERRRSNNVYNTPLYLLFAHIQQVKVYSVLGNGDTGAQSDILTPLRYWGISVLMLGVMEMLIGACLGGKASWNWTWVVKCYCTPGKQWSVLYCWDQKTPCSNDGQWSGLWLFHQTLGQMFYSEV